MIIRYFETSIINNDDTSYKWEEILDKKDIHSGRELTRQEALRIIDEQGLKLVFVSGYGQVFDESTEPFKQQFCGDTVDKYL